MSWTLLFAMLSGTAASAADTIVVEGRIVDRENGRAVQNARVTVTDGFGTAETAVSARDGRYRLIGLSGGDVIIKVDAVGREPLEQTCHVPSGSALRFNVHAASVPMVVRLRARIVEPCLLEPDTSDRYVIE